MIRIKKIYVDVIIGNFIFGFFDVMIVFLINLIVNFF